MDIDLSIRLRKIWDDLRTTGDMVGENLTDSHPKVLYNLAEKLDEIQDRLRTVAERLDWASK